MYLKEYQAVSDLWFVFSKVSDRIQRSLVWVVFGCENVEAA